MALASDLEMHELLLIEEADPGSSTWRRRTATLPAGTPRSSRGRGRGSRSGSAGSARGRALLRPVAEAA